MTAVFHGHAHHGSLEGYTQTNIPAYNVSAPLLRQHFPIGRRTRVIEIPLAGGQPAGRRVNGHGSSVPDGANQREREAAPMADLPGGPGLGCAHAVTVPSHIRLEPMPGAGSDDDDDNGVVRSPLCRHRFSQIPLRVPSSISILRRGRSTVGR